MSGNGNGRDGRGLPWRALCEWAFRGALGLLVWIMLQQIGDLRAVEDRAVQIDRRVVSLETTREETLRRLASIDAGIEKLNDKLDRGVFERLGLRRGDDG